MKIAIIGRTEILIATSEALLNQGHDIVCVITAKAAPEYTALEQDFHNLAKRCGATYACGANIKNFKSTIEEAGAEIGVSINYSGVIPRAITDIFPLGILNAHGGDLPRYRGNACQAWAILNGEERVGLCVHRMIGGELDSGDIITRDYLPIDLKTKVTHAWEWMTQRIPELMVEAVTRLSSEPDYILERQSKDPKDALRCYPRKPEDGRIDWRQSATNILRLINASNKPYAGAFCDYEGDKLTIWDAELVIDDEVFCAVPGQVTKINERNIEVACGKGKVRLLSIELKHKAIKPSELIKSIRVCLD